MEGADKVTAVHARSMQPVETAVMPAKLGGVDAVVGRDGKQTEKAESIQQNELSREISREEIEETVSEIGNFVQNIQRNLQFTVDDNSGETIIRVTDRETDDVIRQIPSEEVLKLQQYIKDAAGILFKAKV